MVMSFVFSADAHIIEPEGLLSEGLPRSLRQFGIRSEKRDDFIYSFAGDKLTSKIPLNRGPVIMGKDGAEFGRSNRKGTRELPGRFEDMLLDGIDAEIIFPTLALTNFLVENDDAQLGTAQVYNDWHHNFFKDHTDRF